MGEVQIGTCAYAKIMLHAVKYPHCAVSGVLLADGSKIRANNQDIVIVDAMPLFHHSHYLSPMAEVALTQIDKMAQKDNRVIAGYYAGCENYNDNTVEQCPGQKIAEKIVEHFPSAVFVVIDNKKAMYHFNSPAIKVHKYSEGKWKPKDENELKLDTPIVYEILSMLMMKKCQTNLVDFDNYLDDLSQDWTNEDIESDVASLYEECVKDN